MQMQEKIKNWIKENLGAENFTVEYPADFSFGDFATNVAMIEAKKAGRNPKDLAEEYVKILNDNKIPEIEKIEIAGLGFINFYLKADVFGNVIGEILESGKEIGKNQNLKGQKFIVEYTDPNPFKEFHIGHLMSNSVGESISRIIEVEGADVKRLSYGGDVGLHVAKAIFGVLAKKDEIGIIKNSDKKTQLKFWATAYVFGSNHYEEEGESKKKIDDLNKIIFDKSDEEINSLYTWGREVSIDHFQEMFRRLDTNFSRNFWESEVANIGIKAVEEGISKNIFEKSDGAVIFRGENYGLHTRVFINSKGVPTYEAKELGLGIKKIEEFHFDKSVVITGNEQNDYFKVLLQVMSLLRPEVADKTTHIGHGMLRFSSGKMSSRKGNIITAESLLEEVKNLVLEKMKEREISDDKKQEIAEMVSVGALRYSILKQAPQKDIIFDIEKSVSFEGDSGPYLQYSAVRANSVLKKCESVKVESVKVDSGWQTINLEKLLERFLNVVERAGKDLAPHYIATYLVNLAGEFNSFYATNKIIDDTEFSPYKIAITQSFANVMTSGLYLLGIKVPDEM